VPYHNYSGNNITLEILSRELGMGLIPNEYFLQNGAYLQNGCRTVLLTRRMSEILKCYLRFSLIRLRTDRVVNIASDG